MDLPRVTVVPGREKSLRQRHPWVFSGSIAKVDGDTSGYDVLNSEVDPTLVDSLDGARHGGATGRGGKR